MLGGADLVAYGGVRVKVEFITYPLASWNAGGCAVYRRLLPIGTSRGWAKEEPMEPAFRVCCDSSSLESEFEFEKPRS